MAYFGSEKWSCFFTKRKIVSKKNKRYTVGRFLHTGSKKGVENEYEVYFAEIRAINDHMIFYLVKILKIGIFWPLKSV